MTTRELRDEVVAAVGGGFVDYSGTSREDAIEALVLRMVHIAPRSLMHETVRAMLSDGELLATPEGVKWRFTTSS